MATSSTSSSSTFTGISTYSSDLQQVLNRALGFAQLPVTQLQNQQNQIASQQGALASLSSKFQYLNSALTQLNAAASGGNLSTAVGDSTVANVSLGSGASAGQYSLAITNIGSQTTTLSKAGATPVTDPSKGDIASGNAFNLVVGGVTTSVTTSDGSLNGLAQAINNSGAAVSATVINIGGTTNPDYRLSIQSTKYAPVTIDLLDSSNNSLIASQTAGTYVAYTINNSSSINSDTRALNFATGLTVNALKVGTTNVSVNTSTSGIASALSAYATAYNNVKAELAKARGQNNGPLSGETIITSATAALQAINSAGSPTASVSSLSSLGLTFDQNGLLSFDSSVLASASASDITTFLGSSTTSGFLKQASDTLSGITDSSNGLIANTNTSYTNDLNNIAAKISADNNRIATLKTSLTKQLSKADSLIASLQSKNTYYTNYYNQIRANLIGG